MKTVDIIIPVYNEEADLEDSVRTLRKFLLGINFPYGWKIVVADNASTDNTLNIAQQLSEEFSEVDYIHLDEKGRGRALKKAWIESNSDIVSYMDVDLSTELNSFPKMINALTEGYDISMGSRLMSGARVKRCFKRELLSRGYNLILKALFFNKFSDAQCGFKAVTRKVVDEIVPRLKDNKWFFDTELLLWGEKEGLKIKEIPVTWDEDPQTKVNAFRTVTDYLRDCVRMRIDLFLKK